MYHCAKIHLALMYFCTMVHRLCRCILGLLIEQIYIITIAMQMNFFEII